MNIVLRNGIQECWSKGLRNGLRVLLTEHQDELILTTEEIQKIYNFEPDFLPKYLIKQVRIERSKTSLLRVILSYSDLESDEINILKNDYITINDCVESILTSSAPTPSDGQILDFLSRISSDLDSGTFQLNF